jgi:hypothetical protein
MLRRMLRRSPGEIAFRAAQQAFILGERATLVLERAAPDRGRGDTGHALRGWKGPRGVGLLTHFRSRGSRFFPGLDDRDHAVRELRSRWPDAEAATIATADRILNGRFDLLGYTGLDFGSPPDWHLDPLLQVRAPARPHWSRIDYLDPAVAGDHKVVWELNRHQYLVDLGQAYWYTADERYAAAFVAHLTSWLDLNPPNRGVNWASSLEVSFRAISWLWALHFFRHSSSLTEPFFARVLRYLQAHAHHIERHLSTYFSPNTHLTGEALGLFYVGSVLPELRHAARWRRTGLAIFAAEMPRQVMPDGVYFEQSTWYHRYTVDFLIHLLALARANGLDAGAPHADTLQRMLHHVLALTRPDGTVPLIGDDDGGCLLPLDGAPDHDFRATLATGAVLFGRGDFKYVAGRVARQTFWLLGARGLQTFDELPAAEPAAGSVAFEEGGFHVMRDGWDADANYLLVDGGPHGSLTGGHAHADALAIVVSCGADNVLVDSGTGTYTTDPSVRDRFRATPAHNTVSMDGHSSSVPAGPFRWDVMASTVVDAWIATERFDFFRGRHDGYTRFDRDLVHERSILFVKRGYWVIRDRIAAAGTLSAQCRFHFSPHIAVVVDDPAILDASSAACRVMRFHTFGASGGPAIERCTISDVYGSVAPATSASFDIPGAGAGAGHLTTLLLPGPAAASEAHRMETQSGTLLVLAHGRFVDWIGVAEGGGINAAGMSTDSAWSWIRRCADTGAVLDYMLIDGSTLLIDGEPIVRRDARVPFICMGRGGDR